MLNSKSKIKEESKKDVHLNNLKSNKERVNHKSEVDKIGK